MDSQFQHADLKSCVGFKFHDVCHFLALSRAGYIPSGCVESPLITWDVVMISYVLKLCPFRHYAYTIQWVRAVGEDWCRVCCLMEVL